MRLLKRNTTEFTYRAYAGETETLSDGRHTGNYHATYAEPVTYRGNISAPSGFATAELFGLNTPYTHVLLLDKPDAGIAENGLIDWNGGVYEIKAVRPSLNVLAVALKKTTQNNAPTPANTTGTNQTGETTNTEQSEGSADAD